jgi:hypothetical protein
VERRARQVFIEKYAEITHYERRMSSKTAKRQAIVCEREEKRWPGADKMGRLRQMRILWRRKRQIERRGCVSFVGTWTQI